MDKYHLLYFSLVSFIGSITSLMFGGFSKIFMFLVVFVVVDYITGIMAAYLEKNSLVE